MKKDGEHWGQYDNTGEPVRGGCRLDLECICEGWPGVPLETAAEMLHSKDAKHAGFRQEYPKARRIKKDSGVLKSRFNPGSTVTTGKTRFKMVYSDVGFLTEAEMMNVTGVAGTSLKLKTHKGACPIEDRGEKVNGYFVSWQDLPEGMYGWIRKVRTGFMLQVQQEEDRLDPARQIRQEQGNLLFDYFSEQMLNQAEPASRTKHRPSLPKVDVLMRQGEELLEAREQVGSQQVIYEYCVLQKSSIGLQMITIY